MSYLVANIPSIEVFVDKRFLYDFQKDEKGNYLGDGEWERGHWVSVKSIPNRALLFETYIDAFGAVYDKLPLHAFRWRDLETDDKIYPLDFLQLWDCLSYNISVIDLKEFQFIKTNKKIKEYVLLALLIGYIFIPFFNLNFHKKNSPILSNLAGFFLKLQLIFLINSNNFKILNSIDGVVFIDF